MTELWTIKLLATSLANQPGLHFGQGWLHCDLNTLDYHLVDMHTLTLQIQIVMAFQICLLVKLKLEKLLKSGIQSSELCLDPRNNYFPTFIILLDLHTCRSCYQEQILFWKWRLSRSRLIMKNQQPSLMVDTNPEFENFEFDSRLRI